MILAPLAGMILNLMDASTETESSKQNDVVGVFASMDCPDTVLCGFQCLLEYNWVSSLSLSTFTSLTFTSLTIFHGLAINVPVIKYFPKNVQYLFCVDKEIFCLHFLAVFYCGPMEPCLLKCYLDESTNLYNSICTRFFTTLLDTVIKICQAGSFRGDAYAPKLRQLEQLSALLIRQTESRQIERVKFDGDVDFNDSECCICYACEADAQFVPCSHTSCFGCISRHLLNCERCFFCNATVLEVVKTGLRKA